MEIAEKYKSRLGVIKDRISQSHDYWQTNAERYQEFMRFVFQSAMNAADERKLLVLQKPAIEFNILEAMISRLRGEFAQQEPGIIVRAADGLTVQDFTPELLETIEVVESHLREIVHNTNNDNLAYKVFSDLLGGGYSVVEVYTDYINERSFEKNICLERVFDPTLTGFDPLARQSHKGDGQYCFKLYPRTREEFEEEYGKDSTKDMRFTRGIKADTRGVNPGSNKTLQEFSWSYKSEQVDIVLLAEYFEKVRIKTKILKLSTGHSVTAKQYTKLLEEWDSHAILEQPPIVLDERMSYTETIHRYVLCENDILDHTITDFSHLPLIFMDGNSVIIQDGENGSSVQMTRPYVYHAMGIQKLKNFAGQTLAAELEDLVRHKFKVALESVPEDQLDAYKNVQQANVLTYNAFYNKNPEYPLPPPQEIMRMPPPPIVENTFASADQICQMIIGSYDSMIGTNQRDVSGVAIQNSAIQSATSSTPYLVGYIQGLNRICEIIVDLIPKYYVTPRSLPIKRANGKRDYEMINATPDQQQQMQMQQMQMQNPGQQQQMPSKRALYMNYDPKSLQIKVEAGVNTAVQKQIALDQIIRMMQSSELFSQFINAQGLETLLDNMDIRGIEALKEQSVIFMQNLQKQQQEQSQKGDPMLAIAEQQVQTQAQTEMAKVQQRAQQAEQDHTIAAAKVAIEQEKVNLAKMEAVASLEMEGRKLGMEEQKIDAEHARNAIDKALEVLKMHSERSPEELDT